jgi:hypothetical protein
MFEALPLGLVLLLLAIRVVGSFYQAELFLDLSTISMTLKMSSI